jgi:hypothetical protein
MAHCNVSDKIGPEEWVRKARGYLGEEIGDGDRRANLWLLSRT